MSKCLLTAHYVQAVGSYLFKGSSTNILSSVSCLTPGDASLFLGSRMSRVEPDAYWASALWTSAGVFSMMACIFWLSWCSKPSKRLHQTQNAPLDFVYRMRSSSMTACTISKTGITFWKHTINAVCEVHIYQDAKIITCCIQSDCDHYLGEQSSVWSISPLNACVHVENVDYDNHLTKPVLNLKLQGMSDMLKTMRRSAVWMTCKPHYIQLRFHMYTRCAWRLSSARQELETSEHHLYMLSAIAPA